MKQWALGVLVALVVDACAMPAPSSAPATVSSPSTAPTAAVTAPPVPALTVDHPTVTVVPATHLRDGQLVDVRVTGFGVGGLVRVSECLAADASDLGCGGELASQTLLATDEQRTGHVSFVVHAQVRPAFSEGPAAICGDGCVIVATLGAGYPYSVAHITFSPDAADVKAARTLAERFLTAFVSEEWATAYSLLEPQSQALWGGSLAAFEANWPHPARDTGGHYTIADEINDPTQAATLAGGPLPGVDMARIFLVDVTFPNPRGLVPGPTMLLVAGPDSSGTWHLWRLR